MALRSAHFPSYVNVGLDKMQNLPLSFDCLKLVDKMPRSHGGVVQTVSDDAAMNVGYLKVFRAESTIFIMRCTSPPLKVRDCRSRVTYPSPTSSR